MEYLDAYDENKKYIGTFLRDEVHEKGMWHNTVHCWLYDDDGNIYFQVRSDSDRLYTTASGHVMASETLKEAFGREVEEEIGIKVNYENAEFIRTNIWKMDSEKKGEKWYDRAFANVYILDISDTDLKFNYNDGEVNGVVKINAEDTLKLFNDELIEIDGLFIGENQEKERKIKKEDFLLFSNETLSDKYGCIVEAIMKKGL